MAKKKTTPKKNRGSGIVRYFRETITELKRVNWPNRKEASKLTGIVLVVVVLMSAFLGTLDLIFGKFIAALIKLV